MNWISPFRLSRMGILGMNRRNVDYIARYNDRDRYPLVDNKLTTKLVAQKNNLVVPHLLHQVNTQREVEHVEPALAQLDKFVVKPAQGSGGRGILVIVGKEDDLYIKSNGDKINLATVKRHLANIISGLHSLGGRTDVAVVESLVIGTPIFSKISYEGVPDIRLIVFKGYPIMGMLRLATKASDGKANLHQGAIGVGLDIGTGKSISAVQYNKQIDVHPDTQVPLINIAVPNWRRLVTLAARCYEVTRLGYLGCDIVLDEHRGPLLLELNARPGLSIQIANNQGLLPRLRAVEELDEFVTPVEERVEYCMQNFTTLHDTEQPSLFE